MMVNGVGAGAQSRHVFLFDRGGVGSFESFRRAEKIERFDVARIPPQSRLGELFRSARPLAKLLRLAWIDLGFSLSVGFVAVEPRLEFPRLVQLLETQADGVRLGTRRILGREVDHLLEVATRVDVVEIKKRLVAF